MIRTDRCFPMPAPPDAVWAALCRPELFPETWPWLRSFDGRELRVGQTWRCVVQPPVPYRVCFAIHLREVSHGERIEADVDGDVRGWARITVAGDHCGTDLRLCSELAPGNGLMRGLLRVVPPLARYGHDWLLDTGSSQFRHARLAP